jgi:outer membrane protein OmpA-like peptidoglycan-associated protein
MAPFFIYTGIILMLPFIFSAPKSTVILLDNNKSHNGVVVTTAAGSTEIDRPNMQTTVSSPEAKPEPVQSVDLEQIKQKYAQTLQALPSTPVSLLFYFEGPSAQLTSESMAYTSTLVELIKSREPCAVDIIGHTDTAGSAELNYELALKRAMMVKSFLEEQHVKLSSVKVESYGESTPLIPTADGVDEPRNRRVEVIVR